MIDSLHVNLNSCIFVLEKSFICSYVLCQLLYAFSTPDDTDIVPDNKHAVEQTDQKAGTSLSITSSSILLHLAHHKHTQNHNHNQTHYHSTKA